MKSTTKTLPTERWWAKARRHQEWYASWLAEMIALKATIDGVNDIQALQKILDRADAIGTRCRKLKRIMTRHLERAPDLLPGLDSPSQVGGRWQ
jgi:hypothetical protein